MTQTITTLDQLVDTVTQSPSRLYVRYMADPQGDIRRGYATNHITGQPEAGLSVEDLIPEDKERDVWAWDTPEGRRDYIIMQLASYSFLLAGGGHAYLLTGQALSSRGGDNELLIRDAALVGVVADQVCKEASRLRLAQADARAAARDAQIAAFHGGVYPAYVRRPQRVKTWRDGQWIVTYD